MGARIKWQYHKLKEIAELVKGRTPARDREEYYAKDGIPWVKIENLTRREVFGAKEYLSPAGAKIGRTVPENAVMLSVNRTIGKTGIAKVPLQTNEQIVSLICQTDIILPEYLYYYFLFAEKQLQRWAYVTVGMRISKASLGDYIVPVPPLSWQAEWIPVLEVLEAYIWDKEDMAEKCRKLEEAWKTERMRKENTSHLMSLLELLQKSAVIGRQLLDTLLQELLQEAEKAKNDAYYSGKRSFETGDFWGNLPAPLRKILQQMSSFQRDLYLQFYKEEKPAAIHEELKKLKKEKPQYQDRHIQDAVGAVEVLRELGLMASPELYKIYYGAEREDENAIYDENGELLQIELWRATK